LGDDATQEKSVIISPTKFNIIGGGPKIFLVLFVLFPILVILAVYFGLLLSSYIGNFGEIIVVSPKWEFPLIKIHGIPMLFILPPIVIFVNYMTYLAIIRIFQRERWGYFNKVELIIESLPASLFLRQVNSDGSSKLIYRGGRYHDVYRTTDDDFRFKGDIFSLSIGPQKAIDTYLACLRDGETVLEWEFQRPGQPSCWIRSYFKTVSLDGKGGGEIIGFGLNIDREREVALRNVNAIRMSSLGEMASSIAHELKQPLQTLSLAAEITMMQAIGHPASAINAQLDTIINQARRAADVIEHLRRFSRGDVPNEPPRPVNLRKAIEGALSLVGAYLRASGITVTFGDKTEITVLAHEISLQQALTNIFMNARDAMHDLPPGQIRQLRISTRRSSAQFAEITIGDTGGGIDPAVLPRLFQPFVTTKTTDSGTGLGLSICHGLLTAMSFKISASNTAEGAQFTITGPAERAQAERLPSQSQST
jgi:signal transduction histidine kinase